MQIAVTNETKAHISSQLVQTTLRTAARATDSDRPNRRVEVSFVSARQIRQLNRRYRGVDRATDVLSFSYGQEKSDGSAPPTVFGEIIIAPDCLAAQTRQEKNPTDSQVRDRLIHGFLHLIGHDHHASRPRVLMRHWEQVIRRCL